MTLQTYRNQLGITNSQDIELLLRLMIEESIIQFPLLYDQSILMNWLRKVRVRSRAQRWPILDSNNQFQQQPLNAPVLYSNFPSLPDNGVYILEKIITAEHFLQNEYSGLVRFTNDEILEAAESGTNAIENLYLNRVRAALNTMMVGLNNLIYEGVLTGNGIIRGLQSVFGFVDTAGVVSTTDSDYVISNVAHGKPSDNTALNGTDYYIKWRPLSAHWDSGANTLTFADGHGLDADVGGGINAAGGTAAVAPTQLTTINDMQRALDEYTLYLRNAGRRYDAIITTPRIAQDYKTLYNSQLNREILNGDLARAELGTAAVATYEGRPIIPDRFCPANSIFFLSRDALEFQTLEFSRVPAGNPLDLQMQQAPMAVAIGALPGDNITIYRYEILTRPGLRIYDTAGVNRLTIA